MNDQVSQEALVPTSAPVEVPAFKPDYVQTDADKAGEDQR